jgi:hypothetical protein
VSLTVYTLALKIIESACFFSSEHEKIETNMTRMDSFFIDWFYKTYKVLASTTLSHQKNLAR